MTRHKTMKRHKMMKRHKKMKRHRMMKRHKIKARRWKTKAIPLKSNQMPGPLLYLVPVKNGNNRRKISNKITPPWIL